MFEGYEKLFKQNDGKGGYEKVATSEQTDQETDDMESGKLSAGDNSR